MGMDHVVATDPDIGTYACAYYGHSGIPYVIIGGDLEGQERRAVIAHELAHHELGHTADHTPARYTQAAMTALGGASAFLAARPLVSATLAATALVAYLTGCAISQGQEFEADRAAVDALNASGEDGWALTLAALRSMPADPWWVRWGGWLFTSHPTARSRVSRIERSRQREGGS